MKFLSGLSLKYKLLLGLLPIVLFAVGFTAYIGLINAQTANSLNLVNEAFLEFRVISRLDVLNTRLAEATKAFALTEDLKWQATYDDISVEFDKLLDDALVSATSIDKQVLNEFELLTNKIKGTELFILFKTRNNQKDEAIELFDTIYSDDQQAASKVLTDYVESKSQNVSADIQAVLTKLHDSENVIFVASIVFVIIIIFLFLFIFSMYILRPLHDLAETAKAIESGDLNARSRMHYDDEIGNLAKAFNSMTSELSNQIKKTNHLLRKEEKNRDLLEARDSALTSANEMLLELDKKKSEFISIVAHQLRTPLSGIKWTLSSFLDGEMGALTLDQVEYLKKTYDSNERIINLVEDMLSADRIESGKNPLVLTQINIIEIIDSVLSDLKSKIQSKNIAVNFNKTNDIPLVNADNDKIRAVIQNVLENAVRYSAKNGNVEIKVSKDAENDEVVVAVRDSGIGIPEDQLKYLFTKFFRAKNAMRMITDGTGLGLFISKKIIDKHKGRMWCESKEGVGSTFYFSLKV